MVNKVNGRKSERENETLWMAANSDEHILYDNEAVAFLKLLYHRSAPSRQTRPFYGTSHDKDTDYRRAKKDRLRRPHSEPIHTLHDAD